MATNRRRWQGRYIRLAVNGNTGLGVGSGNPKSGDPVAVGSITGVCQDDMDASNNATIDRRGVYNLKCTGVDAGGNSAIAVGDKLFWVNGDVAVSKKTSGILLGYALGTVGSGATGNIDVLLTGGA